MGIDATVQAMIGEESENTRHGLLRSKLKDALHGLWGANVTRGILVTDALERRNHYYILASVKARGPACLG